MFKTPSDTLNLMWFGVGTLIGSTPVVKLRYFSRKSVFGECKFGGVGNRGDGCSADRTSCRTGLADIYPLVRAIVAHGMAARVDSSGLVALLEADWAIHDSDGEM